MDILSDISTMSIAEMRKFLKDNDINEFLDQLNTEQFMGVTNFFETMPKLRHTIEVTNPKTNVTSEVLLEGLQSFLG